MGLGRERDGLAPTPPMGWNSWNRFGCEIDERLIRETAEAMVATGMRDAGYRYVVIDDCWEASARDARGDLVADPTRFTSGMRALADHVHSLGLRFGIYTDAGTWTCQGRIASRGNERRDAARFAEWGVDYVKVDWCNSEGLVAPATYPLWTDAFERAGRPMVLSICEWGGSRPWEWAGTVGHLWRTTGDILDRWDFVTSILDHNEPLAPHAGPDHWNDPDMLEVGNGAMTDTEYRAHFGLWSLMAAPLMAGNDVRTMSAATADILLAREVIAVDQDPLGAQGRRVRSIDGAELWVKRLADPRSLAVGLFDRADEPRLIRVTWRELGWDAQHARVRDLWARRELGTFAEGFETEVAPHALSLVRVTFTVPLAWPEASTRR